jgi:hypothetical protein
MQTDRMNKRIEEIDLKSVGFEGNQGALVFLSATSSLESFFFLASGSSSFCFETGMNSKEN